MSLNRFFAALALLSLAACGGSGGNFSLGSRFDPTVGPDGQLTGASSDETTVVRDERGNGYAFAYSRFSKSAVGLTVQAGRPDIAYNAISGILPGPGFGDVPTSGKATFDGRYRTLVVRGFDSSANPSTYDVDEESGRITLNVDFARGTVKGRSDDRRLFVRGNYANDEGFDPSGDFFSDIRYRGVSGFLEGEFGEDGVVAAFAGDGQRLFYAGGLLAD